MATKKKATKRKTAKAEKQVTILLPAGDAPEQQGDLYVGYAGENVVIPRDQAVPVAQGVVDILSNLKKQVTTTGEDGKSEQSEELMYPFEVVH